jgi:hypothetical protein
MRIALLGSAPSSVALAPFKDASFNSGGRPLLEQHQFPFQGEDWQLWGCSPGAYGHAVRADRWFELHRWEPGMAWFSPEYCDWLRAFKGIVYTTEVIPEMPSSTRIPRERIVEEFGQFFLTSSLSFMMAMAIFEIEDARKARTTEEVDEIGLWGVDMAATEEYGSQRAGCHFFMGEASRRGIQVILPPESDLGRPMPMYGICEWTHAHIKVTQRKRELLGRRNAAQERERQAHEEVLFLSGALDDLEYMEKTWILNDNAMLTMPDEKGRQVIYLPK